MAKKTIEEKEIDELMEADPQATIISGGDVEEPKKKKTETPAASRGKKINAPEIAMILNLVIGSFSKLLGYRYQYRDADYKKESEGLERLSVKFPIIRNVLLLADPLIILFGLIDKLRDISKTKPKAEKPAPPPSNVPQDVNYSDYPLKAVEGFK